MSVELRQDAIDLAHEPPFALGGLEVRPAKLEVVAGERREVLEPRIMQVLVALARERGEVVSRDDLIRSCWGGRVVGEDSINRCIFRLRRLAADLGGFSLQTIPRVGYRLTEEVRAPGGVRRLRRTPWIIAACGLVVLIAAAAGVWVWRRSLVVEAREPLTVAVQPFVALDGDPAAKAFALKLTDAVTGLLDDSEEASVPATNKRAASADLIVRGTVSRGGDGWRVRAYLVHRGADLVLLSREFTGATDQQTTLSDRVAAELTESVYTLRQPGEEGLTLDPQTLALWVAGTDTFKFDAPGSDARALQLHERVLQRAPDFGTARAALALILGAEGYEKTPEKSRGWREAERAARHGPYAMGAAADPLYNMYRHAHPTDLAGAEDIMLKPIAAGTRFPFVIVHECRLLVALGRAADAIPHCERAMALRPLAPATGWSYAAALSSAGQVAQARDVADVALRYNPQYQLPRQIRFQIEAFHGSPDIAHEILHAPPPARPLGPPALVAALDEMLAARKSGSPAAADRAIRDLSAATGRNQNAVRYLVFAAAAWGRPDDAFAALATPGVDYTYVEPAILLEPEAAPLRSDPRFWAMAARLGYVAWWRTRNKWPDFCSAPGNKIDCVKMAAATKG